MKKKFKISIGIVIVALLIGTSSYTVVAGPGDTSVDDKTIKDEELRCRCKGDKICEAGKKISIYSLCYKGNQTVNCHSYDSNCVE